MSLEFAPYRNLMQELRATNSLKEKETHLTRALMNPISGQHTANLLRLAYNPYLPYYVTGKTFNDGARPDPESHAETDSGGAYDRLGLITGGLTRREIVGNGAKIALQKLLSSVTMGTAREIERILCKDVDAGISISTINKALANVNFEPIPTFPIMKAREPKFLNALVYPAQVDYKYDGERLVIYARGARTGNYVPFSSEGRVSESNVDVWADAVAAAAKFYDHDNLVIDCEITASSFSALAKTKGKKADRSARTLVIFDIMAADEWDQRDCKTNLEGRTDTINNLFEAGFGVDFPNVTRSKYRICQNRDELEEFYAEAVSDGLEGIVAKHYYSPYEWKRSDHWIKLKPVKSADGKIVAIKPGKPGSEWEHGVGSIKVEGEVGGQQFSVSVGSALTKKLRKAIQDNPDAYLGHYVELKYDCLTEVEGEEIPSLRFPRVAKMRPDRD